VVFRVRKSILHIVVVEGQDRPGFWTILELEERHSESGGSQDTTWSMIKGLYR
jgi:hypothetical protein